MKVKFSKSALKFLDSLTDKEKEKIRLKIKTLIILITERGIIPFKELQIRKLTGKWEGFLRMKIGKIRVVFRIDIKNNTLFIYEIDFRGSIYKKKK